MSQATAVCRLVLRVLPRLVALGFLLAQATVLMAASYPPTLSPPDPARPKFGGEISPSGGPIFSNTHNYGVIEIKVDIFNNYLGDFTKYQWVYTVKNFTYDPDPPGTNGFSGFELALPVFVPDIADITAPDGIPPWIINCCSGQPVEWDLTFADGAPVGGGTLPGQTEVFSFTTLPRLITLSTGWFHTWRNGGAQETLIFYPTGDGPEAPDLTTEPNRELCCTVDAAGNYLCQVRPVGECATLGGVIVPNCDHCPPITPTQKQSWGKVKDAYR